MEFACSPSICSPGSYSFLLGWDTHVHPDSGTENQNWLDKLMFIKLTMTLQHGAMAPLSWWAGESDAGVRLWENTGGMVKKKVLCPLWDCEASMQIGCENDWPAKRSREDSKMCQHLCFSYGKYVSALFIYSQKFRWCLGKFDKHKTQDTEPETLN